MTTSRSVLVWDIPTRIFHWLLAASFAGAFLTAESERLRDVHVLFGYTLLALIGFRLLWGIFGSRYARFTSFAFGPRDVLAYLRGLLTGAPNHYLGHNPAGSWAIFALLALALLAGATGYATYALDLRFMEDVHEALANTLLVVVGVHVAGVLVSSVLHRENLVRAMITGRKHGEPRQGILRRHGVVGLAVLALVGMLWWAGTDNLLPGASAQAASAVHAPADADD